MECVVRECLSKARRVLLPCAGACLLLAGCEGYRVPALDKLKSAEARPAAKPGEEGSGIQAVNAEMESVPSVDLGFLLSMSYQEARSISTQSMEVSGTLRLAADKIEVLKVDNEGRPRRVRATGKVYLETDEGDRARVLCQEAYISNYETVLRGRPILQKGGSIVEGLDDRTVFYLLGSRLRVIGTHRLTNQDAMVASLPDLGPWTGGPNPLLPPLTESAVPGDIRDEMLKAAEAEAVLQQNREEALQQPAAPPAPWIKDPPKKSDSRHEPGSKKPSPAKPSTMPESAPKKRTLFGRQSKT